MKRYRLPKEFALKWLKALRSGKYEQARGRLVIGLLDNKPKYCCLGVACKVLGISDAQINEFSTIHTLVKVGNLSDKMILEIPNELINDRDDPLPIKLMWLNDKDLRSFAEIADWIEENVELY